MNVGRIYKLLTKLGECESLLGVRKGFSLKRDWRLINRAYKEVTRGLYVEMLSSVKRNTVGGTGSD